MHLVTLTIRKSLIRLNSFLTVVIVFFWFRFIHYFFWLYLLFNFDLLFWFYFQFLHMFRNELLFFVRLFPILHWFKRLSRNKNLDFDIFIIGNLCHVFTFDRLFYLFRSVFRKKHFNFYLLLWRGLIFSILPRLIYILTFTRFQIYNILFNSLWLFYKILSWLLLLLSFYINYFVQVGFALRFLMHLNSRTIYTQIISVSWQRLTTLTSLD